MFSPRERGWSGPPGNPPCPGPVLPARAGVVRGGQRAPRRSSRSPRASGGGPRERRVSVALPEFSPRERGWSAPCEARVPSARVLPARAGVVRSPHRRTRRASRSPRASGGGPTIGWFTLSDGVFSPRERGWSGAGLLLLVLPVVLPARAGVVRPREAPCGDRDGSPRASGGGPRRDLIGYGCNTFSPRERGWSAASQSWYVDYNVLPARAGVVRWGTSRSPTRWSSPRASGGGPSPGTSPSATTPVLPARAGVVRAPATWRRGSARSPRASGGGPHCSEVSPVIP